MQPPLHTNKNRTCPEGAGRRTLPTYISSPNLHFPCIFLPLPPTTSQTSLVHVSNFLTNDLSDRSCTRLLLSNKRTLRAPIVHVPTSQSSLVHVSTSLTNELSELSRTRIYLSNTRPLRELSRTTYFTFRTTEILWNSSKLPLMNRTFSAIRKRVHAPSKPCIRLGPVRSLNATCNATMRHSHQGHHVPWT